MATTEKGQYLAYDFAYEGVRHKAIIRLDEGLNGARLLYHEHDLEISWVKRIRHKGKNMIVNIVINDDWNDLSTLGKVVASAWVCVYNKSNCKIVEEFEPDNWSYFDEENPSNSINKTEFYKISTT